MIKLNALFLLIITILFSTISLGQKANKKITITGEVINSKQQPVAGAIIFIDGVKTGYITDNQGKYKINVGAKAKKILVLSSEFGTNEVEIAGKSSIDITLTGLGATKDVRNNNVKKDIVD